jgi:GTP-binding protein HflX
LQRLYRRKVTPHRIVTPELARQLTEISHQIHRQIGVLIDRRGAPFMVIVGDDHQVVIPPIPGVRRGPTRLCGLRFVHTHLKGESLSRDDFTDLAHLRLDLICEIEVLDDGLPGRVQAAHLLPVNPEGKHWETIEADSPAQLDIDTLGLIEALEDEFAKLIRTRQVDGTGERALLVGLYPSSNERAKRSMQELRELTRSSGLQVIDTVMQFRTRPDPRFVLGKGKVEELVIHSKQAGAEVLIFDRDLTPGQLRNLSLMTDQKIIDRTQLILDIFAQHAHSRDGKLQVELAQLKYILPRLVGKNPALSRLRGGIGLRGPGETKLEVDRRRIRDRIARLDRELEQVAKARRQRRAKRSRSDLPILSIVGYTNAGKSTLLNALTKSDVHVEDKLFATLDPGSRRLRFPKERDVIITDTVGFIQDLPTDLINAFRSTLEELEDAHLLLHVADISNEHVEAQIQSVQDLLTEMDLVRVPQLLVFNKVDLVGMTRQYDLTRRYRATAISALQGDGLEGLSKRIRQMLFVTDTASYLEETVTNPSAGRAEGSQKAEPAQNTVDAQIKP